MHSEAEIEWICWEGVEEEEVLVLNRQEADGGGILMPLIAIGHSPEGPDCILPLV